MSRNLRFEINYILSLTIASLGFVSIDGVLKYFDERLGFLFIVLVSIHLLWFKFHYLFKNVLVFDLNRFPEFSTPSRYSFYAVTMFFSYLLSHLLISVVYNHWLIEGTIIYSIKLWSLSTPFLSNIVSEFQELVGRTFMLYGVPFVGVSVFMAPLLAVIPSMRFFDDVDIVVSPEDIEVTDNYEDTKTLSLSLISNSGKEFDFDIAIDLPENIKIQCNGEDYSDSFNRSISLSKMDPAEKLNLQLKYLGNERSEAQIPIKFSHGFTSKTKTVEANLYP